MVNVGIVATGSRLGSIVVPNSYFSGINPDGSDAEFRNPGLEYREVNEVQNGGIRRLIRGLAYKVFRRDENGIDRYLDREKDVVLTNEKIEKLTGIQSRRWAEAKDTLLEYLVETFRSTGFDANLLDGIIVHTITYNKTFSNLGSLTQKELGIVREIGERENFRNFLTYQFNIACAGFTHGLDHAMLKIQQGKGYKYIFVAAADFLSRITDPKELDRDLFADGVGGAVFGEVPNGRGILATRLGSDARSAYSVYMGDDLLLRMPDGKDVFDKGIYVMKCLVSTLCYDAGIEVRNLKLIIPHEANLRMLNRMEKELRKEHSCPELKIYKNITDHGNMSGSSSVISLDEAIRDGSLKPDDLFAIVTVGAGLTYSGALIRGYNLMHPLR